jgi:hypothetical protein
VAADTSLGSHAALTLELDGRLQRELNNPKHALVSANRVQGGSHIANRELLSLGTHLHPPIAAPSRLGCIYIYKSSIDGNRE